MIDAEPNRRPRVVVVGGGFAGLAVVRELADVAVDITIVDKNNFHLFQPLLYQVATGGLSPGDIAAPIRFVVAKQKNVSVRVAEVTGVDFDRRLVRLREDRELPYDYLVLAAGASSDYFGKDAWEEFAPSLKTINDALEMRTRILGAFEEAEWESDPEAQQGFLRFVVIGGGPTGVEMAGAVAEIAFGTLRKEYRNIDPALAEVHLVEMGPALLAGYPDDLQLRARQQLEDLGVRVRLGERVEAIDTHGIVMGGERLRTETVVWAAGVRAAELSDVLDTDRDRKGRIRVNADLSLPAQNDAFAIGDLAAFEEEGKVLPGIAPVAVQMGKHLGQTLRKEVLGNGARPGRKSRAEARPTFHYKDRGTMATIGRNRAVAMIGKHRFSGRLAWASWALIHLFFLIGFRNRLVVFVQWIWTYLTWQRNSRLVYRRPEEKRDDDQSDGV